MAGLGDWISVRDEAEALGKCWHPWKQHLLSKGAKEAEPAEREVEG